MKVALVQMKVLPGQTRKNLEKIKSTILIYDKKGFDVVVFPELCLGGYLVGDLWYDPDWIHQQLKARDEIINHLVENNVSLGVIFGGVRTGDSQERNQDGRPRIYNSAYFAQCNPSGQVEVEYSDKALLPNYRFFDDKRYFSPGGEVKVHTLVLRDGGLLKMGLEVCEDMWHEDYPRNPTEELCNAGAQVIFNISASPYSYNKRKARDRVIEKTLTGIDTKDLRNFFYVNCVGSQNNGKNILTFDGDSGVYDHRGVQHLGTNNLFHEEVLEYDSKLGYSPFICDNHPKVELQFQACVEGLRSLDTLMGAHFPYIIGVSGGIDSAVVLCLLEQAVGKQRIQAFNLPSRYNSSQTKDNAASLCSELGVPLQVLPIQDLVDLQIQTLREAGFTPSELNMENIQAKTRGTTVLSNLAGLLGGVMTNNGNKVEIALGYATLYGDVNGAIAPLGDLLKTEVWELAEYLNEEVYRRKVIPENLVMDRVNWEIILPPSAELKNNQIDPMKWGYHDALLAYLLNFHRGSLRELVKAYKRSGKALAEILAKATDFHLEVSDLLGLMEKYGLMDPEVFKKDLFWVIKTMNQAVFKRIQCPPIIVQSKAAYGYDIRESQLVRDWSDLEELFR